MTFCCCFLAVSNTNGQDWESASPVFCSKPPHVSRGRLMFHRENAINESCVLIFIFIFLQQNVKEPRKTRTTLSLRKNCSPTSISSCIPLLVGAFKQKQKQTLACSNHKRDDWSWKTIMQKWSEPFLSSPTQNTWCHKCLWQFLILLHKMKKWGEFQMFTDLQYSLHNVHGESANSLGWGEEEKNYNHFNLKGDHFYLTELKRN